MQRCGCRCGARWRRRRLGGTTLQRHGKSATTSARSRSRASAATSTLPLACAPARLLKLSHASSRCLLFAGAGTHTFVAMTSTVHAREREHGRVHAHWLYEQSLPNMSNIERNADGLSASAAVRGRAARGLQWPYAPRGRGSAFVPAPSAAAAAACRAAVCAWRRGALVCLRRPLVPARGGKHDDGRAVCAARHGAGAGRVACSGGSAIGRVCLRR